jgi:hypothetical protein
VFTVLFQKEELDEIQQREEQLELYIEEKEDLLMVKSDKPFNPCLPLVLFSTAGEMFFLCFGSYLNFGVDFW